MMMQGAAPSQADILAAMGRGGDTMMAHMTPGEITLPQRIVSPALMDQILRAMDEGGLDPSRYVAGSPSQSMNPMSGMAEFFDTGDPGEAGGMGPGGNTGTNDAPADVGPSDADVATGNFDSPEPDPMDAEDAGRGAAMIDGLTPSIDDPESSGFSLGGLLGGGFLSGVGSVVNSAITGQPVTGPAVANALTGGFFGPAMMGYGFLADLVDPTGANQSFGNDAIGGTQGDGGGAGDMSRGVASVAEAPRPSYARPAAMNAPQFLGMSPAMTPLQQRSYLATFGTRGENSAFRSPEALNYYSNLLQRDLVGDNGGLNTPRLLPVEQEYLQRAYNIRDTQTADSILSALSRFTV